MKAMTDNTNDHCAGFLADLDPWLAGELDASHSLAMEAHHDVCPACQLEARLAREIDAITGALPAQVCPDLQLPLINPTGGSPAASRQWVKPLPGPTLLSRLLATWRQPLVFVPAFALVLVTLVVLQLRVPNAPTDSQSVFINGEEYTRDEILKAAADLDLALRYLDKYGSYPARVVQAELEQSQLPLPPPQAQRNPPTI